MLRLVEEYPAKWMMWKVSKGLDKSRQTFTAADADGAIQLKTEVDKQLEEKGNAVQGSWIGKQRETKIVYNFVSPSRLVLANRLAFSVRVFLPSKPRFIAPQWGLEIAVAGWAEVPGAQYFCTRNSNSDRPVCLST
ncbi:hypothetical protein R3P38DRAFT_3205485 [Favolaschia claudopus]|uniref:Uncharacterized protein n=1 Tax=Favolaschia claudopus TaxID=2862362 RepID=A0AAW0AMX0_9AGAR